MRINKYQAHLSYCSNIHAGESWTATFENLKKYTTKVRDGLKTESFGIGLRLSNEASLELSEGDNLAVFKDWLVSENMYVFTINGFPYGGFHNQVVKDEVHTPDWSTPERLAYTIRLFDILAELLPEGLDGGVSTSPISYRFWHKDDAALKEVKAVAVRQLSQLMIHLAEIKTKTGKSLHLDMEPEPDGILETSDEFVDFFNDDLLPSGKNQLSATLGIGLDKAEEIIREHFQLCYDVCHFAVGFEKPSEAIAKVKAANIKIGRIQISAALSSGILGSQEDRAIVQEQLKRFDEPTYLHQAVVRKTDGALVRYKDLGPGLADIQQADFQEIRTHFHVPVFTEKYEKLISTQQDIIATLAVWKEENFTNHLEVETYTWDVLPEAMQTDIVSCVVRELDWVRTVATA
ncbi:metabolite traffic protein EboE [Arcticibacterium luteifluviistationis]|uniref:Xylose isomerase n=1 Tax=Arcticibacterium luteifluviistationis TaxID=1784714 RepID=A0A2Z4GAC2_9BACT|nr:metabolite traffic protein EboE [Arcticibacterium luteifluviistationis]AWV98202.1 xylose isomerase [Arcticibacterium luteifluviistationis]